jgi:hypothetical protein
MDVVEQEGIHGRQVLPEGGLGLCAVGADEATHELRGGEAEHPCVAGDECVVGGMEEVGLPDARGPVEEEEAGSGAGDQSPRLGDGMGVAFAHDEGLEGVIAGR